MSAEGGWGERGADGEEVGGGWVDGVGEIGGGGGEGRGGRAGEEGAEKGVGGRKWGGGGGRRLIDVVVYCGRCRVSRDSLEHN